MVSYIGDQQETSMANIKTGSDQAWTQFSENTGQPTIYGGIEWANMEAQAAMAKEASRVAAPYITAGHAGLTGLSKLTADPSYITQLPGYQTGFEQGTRGLEQGAAARGNLFSGAEAKALTRFGSDYGRSKFQEEWDRLYKSAYSGNPFGSIGAPNYPTLRSMQGQYGDMYGQGGGYGAPPPQPEPQPQPQYNWRDVQAGARTGAQMDLNPQQRQYYGATQQSIAQQQARQPADQERQRQRVAGWQASGQSWKDYFG